MNSKTYSAKPSEVTRKWYVIDASQAPLGRISTKAATLLTGKEKPMFTKHIDCGDFVIIINAEQTVVTGKKSTDKMYYRHSNYPGGLTELTFNEVMAKDPTTAIFKSIRGMLPVNKLRDERLKRLKIYAGPEHNHAAQKPEILTLEGDNK
ncbi:50S ribosomal protein L13 [Candidatus Saccharibacteria bacterium]|nr:50S ribosomal protein L13 [Candidatus Saccharibacteria bacterium]